jgi:LysR family transcriptional regulator, glycine cleavage system transcriptional activator
MHENISSMELPSLNALRAFEVAARLGSFTRAAGELHVTQSAVSHQVCGLEEALGALLFERRPRALRLTPAGAVLAEAVRQALAGIAEGTRRVRAARPLPLTVSVLPSFGARWLLPRLPRFRARWPEIELRIHASRDLVHFGRDEVDAAVRYAPRGSRGLHSERLLSERLFPVCAPRLARRLRSVADLRRCPLLHDESQGQQGGWREWLQAAGGADFDWERGTTFTDAHMMLEAAGAGQGVALARSALAEGDLASGRLVRPFRLSVPAHHHYYFVCPRAALRRPEVRALRDFLVREAAARRACGSPGHERRV